MVSYSTTASSAIAPMQVRLLQHADIGSSSPALAVHFSNTADLLDRLTYAGINRFRFRMFTDSAHNMGVRNAYMAVYRTMTDFLVENLGKAQRIQGVQEV